MNAKFYTISLLFFILVNACYAQHLKLQNESKGKIVELPLNQKVSFQLHSDSTLGVQFSDDYGMIVAFSDSSLILDDQRQILFLDLKFIKIFPKERYKAKMLASPFLIAGAAITLRGVVMTFGEGLESKNRIYAPLNLLMGGVISTVSSIPFWGLPKKYVLDAKAWQIIPLAN